MLQMYQLYHAGEIEIYIHSRRICSGRRLYRYTALWITDLDRNSDLVVIFILGTGLDLANSDLSLEINIRLVMALGRFSKMGL